MKTAVTIGRKFGETGFELILGPECPISSHREVRRQLVRMGGNGYEDVQYFEKAEKHIKFRKDPTGADMGNPAPVSNPDPIFPTQETASETEPPAPEAVPDMVDPAPPTVAPRTRRGRPPGSMADRLKSNA